MVGTETPNYLKPKGNSAGSPDWEIQEWMWLWEGSGRKKFWLAWLGSGAIPWANQCGQDQFSHSIMSDSAIPWTAARQASLSITKSWSLLKLMSIESVMPSNHLILCHPLLLPSIFPSIRVFSNESTLHVRWPKYWSFNFNISPSNEHSGLISFSMDWLDLLTVQGTLKSLLQPQFKSINSSAHSYKTIGMGWWLGMGLVGQSNWLVWVVCPPVGCEAWMEHPDWQPVQPRGGGEWAFPQRMDVEETAHIQYRGLHVRRPQRSSTATSYPGNVGIQMWLGILQWWILWGCQFCFWTVPCRKFSLKLIYHLVIFHSSSGSSFWGLSK